MSDPLVLASTSEIRATLLHNANVPFETVPARVDEEAIRDALLAEETAPRDIADALAEAKARKVSMKLPSAMVLGCDQVLEADGKMFSKPANIDDARDQLKTLRGKTHRLLSAAVVYKDMEPIWRHVGVVRLTMRHFSDDYLDEYLERNWDSIKWAVGAYKLEEEGSRLMARIEGDYFNVLGLPLLELLNYLTIRGDLKS